MLLVLRTARCERAFRVGYGGGIPSMAYAHLGVSLHAAGRVRLRHGLQSSTIKALLTLSAKTDSWFPVVYLRLSSRSFCLQTLSEVQTHGSHNFHHRPSRSFCPNFESTSSEVRMGRHGGEFGLQFTAQCSKCRLADFLAPYVLFSFAQPPSKNDWRS